MNLQSLNNNILEQLQQLFSNYAFIKKLYIKEFDDAKIKYNEKQTRNDRKIENDTDFDYYETKKKFSFKLLCI